MLVTSVSIHESSAPLFREEGRVLFSDRGLLMDWSMSGAAIRFCGRSITLTFAPYFSEEAVYLETVIDGISASHPIYEKANRIVITTEPGEHTLLFHRLTEGEEPLLLTEIRLTAFEGEACELLTPPPADGERVVFIGDSITCGYGVLGHQTENFFTTSEEDPRLAYACRTAQLLGVRAELVSISGRGVVRNWNGEPMDIIPEFILRQCRTRNVPHDFAGDRPAVVVINAGTNDHSSGLDKETFGAGVCDLLTKVRALYPAAPILWVYGLMDSDYNDVITGAVRKLAPVLGNVHALIVDPIYRDEREVGANGHPAAPGAERAAHEVAKKLAEITAL